MNACIVFVIYAITYYCIMSGLVMKHKNYKKRDIGKKYYVRTLFNTATTFVVFYFIYTYRDFFFVGGFTFNLKNIIYYFVFIDTLLYWSHRLTHRIPILKNWMHSLHHNIHDLLPLDFMYLTLLDYNLYFLVDMLVPLFFINVSQIEYLCIVGVIFWQSTYIHSEVNFKFPIPGFIDSKYHKRHHQIGGGNYGQYFTIWDDYMGTRIKNIKKKCNR